MFKIHFFCLLLCAPLFLSAAPGSVKTTLTGIPFARACAMLGFDQKIPDISEASFITQVQQAINSGHQGYRALANNFHESTYLDDLKTIFAGFDVLPSAPHTTKTAAYWKANPITACVIQLEKRLDELTNMAEIKKWTSKNLPQQEKNSIDNEYIQNCVERLQKILRPTIQQAKLHPHENALTYIKNMLMTLLRRITADSQEYVSYIKGTVSSNFAQTPAVKPENAYRYLGFSINPAHIPFKSIAQALKEKKEKGGTDQDLFALRQVTYLFSTHVSKQEFDYYLAGEEYLKKLAWVAPNILTADAAKQLILDLFQQISVCTTTAPSQR